MAFLAEMSVVGGGSCQEYSKSDFFVIGVERTQGNISYKRGDKEIKRECPSRPKWKLLLDVE
jgi:hypothetical protein